MLEEKEIIFRPNVNNTQLQAQATQSQPPNKCVSTSELLPLPNVTIMKKPKRSQGKSCLRHCMQPVYSILRVFGSWRGPLTLWEEINAGKGFGLNCMTGDCSCELVRRLHFETSNLLSPLKGLKLNPPGHVHPLPERRGQRRLLPTAQRRSRRPHP